LPGIKNIIGYEKNRIAKMKQAISIFLLFTIYNCAIDLSAQPVMMQDYSQLMEIPQIKSLESSATHLYVLSDTEGLIVFRAHADSLQWLYSSTGMQRRGNKLQADTRFAYLYGDGRRLTVIEPTSVLGVYSATVLPEQPMTVKRIGNSLYIVLNNLQLARIALDSPEAVDTEAEVITSDAFSGKNIIDITADRSNNLYVLTDQNTIELFRHESSATPPAYQRSVQIDRSASKLFFTNDNIYASDSAGTVFKVGANGESNVIATLSSSVTKLDTWNENVIIRTENGLLWIVRNEDETENWKDDQRSGNYFTVTSGSLWISEFNQVFPVRQVSVENQKPESIDVPNSVTLKEVSDITIPFPKTVLIPLEIEENYDAADLEFYYQSSISNAKIKGQSFYWQPMATQTGRHMVNIIAQTSKGLKDSTSFWIDLKSFNAPPRFTPRRPITIPANEPFELEIQAVDPDGVNPDLLRYLGVDLPDGASLDEQTGLFRWTPTLRQVRTWEFKVIATDQFGAASSQNIEINVIEMTTGETGNLN